jgi:hypothetical protein
MAISSRGEIGVGGGSKGPGGYSYRGSELTAAEKRALVKQNKSAQSLKNTDLDKLEKGRAARAAAKAAAAAAKAKAIKKAETKGKIKGAAATVGLGSAMKLATFTKEDKNKSKTTAKAKKTLTASEKAFIKNQKEKAKATKRTGVYPNTAN